MINPCSRRQVLAGAAALAVPRAAWASARPPILVELFTSQGCSSCPAADQLAGDLIKRDDLMLVSFNVDYWDYLGWKDTLARPEFTKRQRGYAKARGDGDVYTPQIVVNGEMHAVGSRKSQVETEISECSPSAAQVPLSIAIDSDAVIVDAQADHTLNEATLWLMSVAPKITVAIGRGENEGNSITYYNVVRSLTPMGMYHGSSGRFAMPREAVIAKDAEFCLAVLQRDMLGQVVGFARAAVA